MTGRFPIHTIGHSTLGIDAFLGHLDEAGIKYLADVRALPGSRAQPQFDQAALCAALARHGITYCHLADLGGRRGRQPGVAEPVNAWWHNASFHHYADWALQPTFRAALAALREAARRQRTAIMCAEAVWWRCHRRIIADHLLAGGEDVRHIMARGIVPATLTPAARVDAAAGVTYPDPASPP